MVNSATAAGKVLVTGGAGFIGSHLVDRLLAEGHQVACVDNFILGKREHLAAALRNEAFSLHDFDLLDLERLNSLFAAERFDMVYHLAANSDIRAGVESTDRDLQLTFLTTYNVLECMRRNGATKLLFTSTAAIFGEHGEPLREDTPAKPESLYGASKLSSEAFIMAYSGLYNIQTWICRLSNIVGDRATHGVIYDLLNKLASNPNELVVLGDGTQTKPYMFVHELIEAFLFIVEHSHDRLNVFNIGPLDGASVAAIAEMVLEEAGAGQTIAYTGGRQGWKGDVALYRYDPSKLEALGWPPPLPSVEACRKAINAIVREN